MGIARSTYYDDKPKGSADDTALVEGSLQAERAGYIERCWRWARSAMPTAPDAIEDPEPAQGRVVAQLEYISGDRVVLQFAFTKGHPAQLCSGPSQCRCCCITQNALNSRSRQFSFLLLK